MEQLPKGTVMESLNFGKDKMNLDRPDIKAASMVRSYKTALRIAGDNSRDYKKSIVLFIVSFTAQALALLCFLPLFSALFGTDGPMAKKALFWLCIMAALALVELVLRWYGHDFDFSGTIVDVAHRLRLNLGEKLKTMPMETLSQYKTGELNYIFSIGVEYAVMALGVVGSVILQAMIPPVVVIGAMFLIQCQMALAMLVVFAIAMPVQKWHRQGSNKEKKQIARAVSRVESDVLEYIQGLPVLRAVNQTGGKATGLQASLGNLQKVQIRGTLGKTIPGVMVTGIVELGLVAVLVTGVFMISKGSLSLPAAAAVLVIISRFIEPLSLFTNITQVLDIMDTAFIKIRQLMAMEPLKVNAQSTQPKSFDIEFDHVGFAYDNTLQPALNDVSFSIPAGKLTAIVGPSGSGKTTITRLIMRYADPISGFVKIGGTGLTHIAPEDVMKNLSVVFQDVYLFDDTILNNIRMGNPKASDQAVKIAAQKAFCHEFISRLPKGYDTVTGDIGGALSGGEKQRISIARAILKDAPVVMLDEPTAALDTQSEVMVQKAIDALIEDKTVIVIAHRLSTIAGAHNILVVEEGRICEQGNHAQLMAGQGRYYSMWNAQAKVKNWNLTAMG